MRYATIRSFDTVNAKGIHTSLFFQGCIHHCKNCWNKDTWNFEGGKELTQDKIYKFIENSKKNYIHGISLLGGEPFNQNPQELLEFLKLLKQQVGKDIWVWTGYEIQNIPDQYKECLDYIDYIIDGKYIDELRDLKLFLRGSKNQKIWKNIQGTWIVMNN